MPRQSRIILPHCPHHVIQRGHNRQRVFAGDADFLYYLENVREWKEKLGCKVYSYCLMSNHVHLVIDPGDDPANLGLLMKRVAGRQTRFFNKMRKCSGSLWEGRYKSSPIHANEYLLACCRYVELNPFRAGMVEDPTQYLWSSCSVKAGFNEQPWLDFDLFYLAFGNTSAERAMHYARWLKESIPEEELRLIRGAIQRGQPTGNKKFAQEISAKIGRQVELRGPGRPKKAE